MKEKIYTIPVNESFLKDCECPVCELEKKLESDAVDYTLGAAMMEPDFRLLSNDLGFCRHHFSMLFNKQNKLSLSLVLDTHLEEYRKKLCGIEHNISALANEKGSFFKKTGNNALDTITKVLNNAEHSCVICDKINNTVGRYIEVIFYLWKNDSEFQKKIADSKGFCMHHFNILCSAAFGYLDKKSAAEFVKQSYEKQLSEFERLQTEIHKFTLKFDYRNRDMDLGKAIDAPYRTIEKIAGYISCQESK